MQPTTLAPLDPLRRYSIEDAAQYLSISRARVYEHIATGTITPIKDGRRTFVAGSAIARLCAVPA
jgi:excisionase family DNA binding protein